LARADRQTSRQHRDQTSRQHREYLKWVIAQTGKKPTPLAREIGIAASTLSRVLKEGSTTTLRADTLSKLQEYMSLFVSGDSPAAPGLRGLAEDAVPFDAERADPAVSAAIRALIGSREEADSRTIRTRALEGLGYLPGDIVIIDLRRKPVRGDVVCAQVSELGRSEPETVMRIYQPPVLVAATFDEQLQRLLWVDDPRVKIEGVVLPHRLRPGAPTSLIG
jgi:DNA-binding Xre family transcriptional regulator